MKCKCDFRTFMVGDGCDVCHPAKALEYAQTGLIPGGAHSNRQFFSCKVDLGAAVSPVLVDLLYDPQTSGGLL